MSTRKLVTCSGSNFVKAKCTYFSYTGSNPTMTVRSDTNAYPTYSVSFTDTNGGNAKKMYYTSLVPVENMKINFKATINKNELPGALTATVGGSIYSHGE